MHSAWWPPAPQVLDNPSLLAEGLPVQAFGIDVEGSGAPAQGAYLAEPRQIALLHLDDAEVRTSEHDLLILCVRHNGLTTDRTFVVGILLAGPQFLDGIVIIESTVRVQLVASLLMLAAHVSTAARRLECRRGRRH
jgi:hypothetical protein